MIEVIGYFKHCGFVHMLTNIDDEMLVGCTITPLGKIHTLHIAKSEVYELTLIDK